jgi:hypothetical protein
VYVEPYPKSRVFDLHSDAVQRDDGTPAAPLEGVRRGREARIQFVPFIGLSPRRHEQLFAMTRRKYADQASRFNRPIVAAEETWEIADWDIPTSPLRSALRGPETRGEVVARHETHYLGRFPEHREKVGFIPIRDLIRHASVDEGERPK